MNVNERAAQMLHQYADFPRDAFQQLLVEPTLERCWVLIEVVWNAGVRPEAITVWFDWCGGDEVHAMNQAVC